MGGPRKKGSHACRDSAGDDGPLQSAQQTRQPGRARLAAWLEEQKLPARTAGTLSSLAEWWLSDPRRESETAAGWTGRAKSLRDQLLQLPGINRALADRVLLLVGNLPAFPIDRPTMRIAARHGWVELEADYDDWQAFFVRAANDAGVTLSALPEAFATLGKKYCGAVPKCDECPLRPLLPASGPIALGELD